MPSAREVLDNLRRVLDETENDIITLVDESSTTPEEWGNLYVELEDIVKRVKWAQDMVGGEVASRISWEPLFVNGAVLEKTVGKERKAWDHKALKSVVVEAVMKRHVDSDGVITTPISQLMTEVLDFPGISYWKVGELKKAGITADRFCDSKPGNAKIRIHRGDTYGKTPDDD